jgi:hypothetical protein
MAKRTPKQEAELNAILASQLPIISKAAPKDGKLVLTKDLQIKVKKSPSEAKVKPAKVEKVKEEKKPKKADAARAIFEETLGQERKVILDRFINEAGLTKAGANTYLANFRKATGLK